MPVPCAFSNLTHILSGFCCCCCFVLPGFNVLWFSNVIISWSAEMLWFESMILYNIFHHVLHTRRSLRTKDMFSICHLYEQTKGMGKGKGNTSQKKLYSKFEMASTFFLACQYKRICRGYFEYYEFVLRNSCWIMPKFNLKKCPHLIRDISLQHKMEE